MVSLATTPTAVLPGGAAAYRLPLLPRAHGLQAGRYVRDFRWDVKSTGTGGTAVGVDWLPVTADDPHPTGNAAVAALRLIPAAHAIADRDAAGIYLDTRPGTTVIATAATRMHSTVTASSAPPGARSTDPPPPEIFATVG
jgi:hypothetical protein